MATILKLPLRTVYALIHTGKLVAYKVAGMRTIRIYQRDFETFLREQMTPMHPVGKSAVELDDLRRDITDVYARYAHREIPAGLDDP